MMKRFKTEQQIDKPIDEVFSFFAKVENLERITPAWLNFKIITPLPVEMRSGTKIDYQIKLYGVPLNWKTEITRWDPPSLFIDTQLKGPYSAWIHEHRFAEQDGKTIMHDTVDYDIPAGFLTPLINKFFIEKQINAIFAYRRREIERYFSQNSILND
jgi:ligand-binding SRPBCC domain-containing protein